MVCQMFVLCDTSTIMSRQWEVSGMRVTAGMVGQVRSLAEPRWSPDGAWLAYLESFDGRGDVMLIPSAGGPARRITADPGAQPTASYGGGGPRRVDAPTGQVGAPGGPLP